VPATGHAGRPLAITHTVRNAWTAPAGAFAIRFFLSTHDTFDASDVLPGTRAWPGLAPAPAARPSARSSCRTLGQTELDETNNAAVTAALPMTPYLPDLLLTAVTVPATARGGRSLAITHAVRNAGPAPAGAFAIRFYLTGDDALDSGDLLLGTRNVPSLGAGASSTSVSAFLVPSTVAAGAYRVVAVAAALGQQTELDEANATASGVVTVSP